MPLFLLLGGPFARAVRRTRKQMGHSTSCGDVGSPAPWKNGASLRSSTRRRTTRKSLSVLLLPCAIGNTDPPSTVSSCRPSKLPMAATGPAGHARPTPYRKRNVRPQLSFKQDTAQRKSIQSIQSKQSKQGTQQGERGEDVDRALCPLSAECSPLCATTCTLSPLLQKYIPASSSSPTRSPSPASLLLC